MSRVISVPFFICFFFVSRFFLFCVAEDCDLVFSSNSPSKMLLKTSEKDAFCSLAFLYSLSVAFAVLLLLCNALHIHIRKKSENV